MAKNTIFMIITTVINDINKTICKFLKTSPGLMQITLKLMCAILHEIYEFCCRHPHRTSTMCIFFYVILFLFQLILHTCLYDCI